MKIVEGDLLKLFEQGEFDVIVHGCNCFSTFGAGIALQIKNKYPIAYQADRQTPSGDKSKLGKFSLAAIINPNNKTRQYIVNAYTQYHYGRDKVNVDYDALRNCFKAIKLQFSGLRIGFPAIGAGLAGGDWNIISEIIDTELKNEDTTLVVYKP